ncbi:MAG TPA: polyprenyl synthetase family protein [Candidatus Krumholzibacteria bacterium]|nr:polyprenyl synthetase family protein [Candidatus Krumholzibacteria bacterium]HRX51093.1 polyprenyl synthetase family protein [Candidatus Krumholzibacteria bacterium]
MSLLDRQRVQLLTLQRIIGGELKRFEAAYDAMMSGETPLIEDVCAHVRNGKSKRFRPTLLLLSAKHEGDVPDGAIAAAACVEMIHTATLLHDDIIDEALTRRGLPSINEAWGVATAVVMGDYLYSKALDVLAAEGMGEALRLLAGTTFKMSQAEMMQLETKHDLAISEETYLTIIERKTASLIESACAIGAGFHPQHAGRTEVFGEFGRKIGFVFQITDDIFDYLGDERRLGKPTGQDWEEGRITLPLIAALRQAPPAERDALLAEIAALPPGERRPLWPRVKSFVLDNGGVDYARDLARRLGDEGKDALAPVAAGAQKDLLTVAVEYVLRRLN